MGFALACMGLARPRTSLRRSPGIRDGASSRSRAPATPRPRQFATHLGAVWAGGTDEPLPEELDAAIIFAPSERSSRSLSGAVRKGGTVVCAGIHMSDIPSFSYDLLWGERTLRSVANLTRRDGTEFLALAHQIPVHAEVETLPLEQANVALYRLRAGDVQGALVLTIQLIRRDRPGAPLRDHLAVTETSFPRQQARTRRFSLGVAA